MLPPRSSAAPPLVYIMSAAAMVTLNSQYVRPAVDLCLQDVPGQTVDLSNELAS